MKMDEVKEQIVDLSTFVAVIPLDKQGLEMLSVNKNGEVITAPDQSTRLKAIELILKYKIGNPRMREEIEVKQELSMDDLKRMATRSPRFAKALREVLQTVETG